MVYEVHCLELNKEGRLGICIRPLSEGAMGCRHTRDTERKERNKTCQDYAARFKNKKILTCHIFQHTKENPYTCNICHRLLKDPTQDEAQHQFSSGIENNNKNTNGKKKNDNENSNSDFEKKNATENKKKTFDNDQNSNKNNCSRFQKMSPCANDIDKPKRHISWSTKNRNVSDVVSCAKHSVKSRVGSKRGSKRITKPFNCKMCMETSCFEYKTRIKPRKSRKKTGNSNNMGDYDKIKSRGKKANSNDDGDYDKIKWHTCQVCKKQYLQKIDLMVHNRLHMRIKPYTCDICQENFRHKSTLLSHVRNHTNGCRV